MTVKTDVLFLQKDRFELYSSAYLRVFEFLYVPEIIQDFDVKNSDLMEDLLKIFINNNKIPPSELIVVLSDNICFIKDIVNPITAQPVPPVGQQAAPAPQPSLLPQPSKTPEEIQKEVELFVSHVPFDNVAYVSIPLPNGSKICATNEDIYKVIISSFENAGFKVNNVIPGIVFGNNLSAKPTMDPAMGNFILQNINSIKQHSFLKKKIPLTLPEKKTEIVNEVPEHEKEKHDGKNNKRLIVLVGAFIVLLLILVVVYVMSLGQAPSSVPKTQSLSPAPLATQLTLTPSNVAVSTVPGKNEFSNLSLQIINASASSAQGEFLRELLVKYGFKSVALQTQSSVGTTSTVIKFSPNVSPDSRATVLNEVKKVTSNIQVQEKAAAGVDVEILLGK